MRFIQRRTYPISGGTLDSGEQILGFLVTPALTADGKVTEGADYEQTRKLRKAIRYIRGDSDTECSVPIGSYIRLEDAVYDHLMSQAKKWRWAIVEPATADMVDDWESAPEDEPKTDALI